jgi:hypothetical protein
LVCVILDNPQIYLSLETTEQRHAHGLDPSAGLRGSKIGSAKPRKAQAEAALIVR